MTDPSIPHTTGPSNNTAPQPTYLQSGLRKSKAGFDKLWAAADRLGAPVNRLSNKIGSEAFWPTTLDKESDKAARILQSFCKDGFYSEDTKGSKSEEKPEGKQRVLKKIPEKVIKEAKGLAIFTTMRTGLWVAGAGGSGIVVARKEDGSWSEPSGILLHTAGLGWLIGVDIYDCVLVLRTQQAVDAFRHLRWTVGGELSAVAGPVGVGGYYETEVHKRQAPIFTYLKSRGFYAGVQVDGTVVIERTDENERFYGARLPCTDILAGKVKHPPHSQLKMLRETLKAAQGDTADPSALPTGQAPSDFEVEETGHVFGVPDKEDPDPYGVHALEQEGLHVNDAATHSPAPEEEFEFKPSEKSPIFPTYNKPSAEEIEKEKHKVMHRVPPAYEGPRVDAPDREAIFNEPKPRTSSDAGTQTESSRPTLNSDEIGVIASEEREKSMHKYKSSNSSTQQTATSSAAASTESLAGSKAAKRISPPSLPPRAAAVATPIQMEDNEEPEDQAGYFEKNDSSPQDVRKEESNGTKVDGSNDQSGSDLVDDFHEVSLDQNGTAKKDDGLEDADAKRDKQRIPGGFD